MNFTLFVLIIVCIGIFSTVSTIIKMYLKNGLFSWDYGIATAFMIVFAIFLTSFYLKKTEFQKNLDATFAYFDDCSAAIKFDKESSQPPFIVESCGSEYEVFVKKGIVQKVNELN